MTAENKKQFKKIKVHKVSYIIVLAIVIAVVLVAVVFVIKKWQADYNQAKFQESVQPFYTPPSPLADTKPGTLIRSEKIDVAVPYDGSVHRVLYVTQKPDGSPTAVSGMVFLPSDSSPVPEGGRKVIAWAHGTLGFGNECTPSRSMNDTLHDTGAWLDAAMQRGYIVAATDYVGMGTPGDRYYLIGKSEAYDVINSVRAARNMQGANAGSEFVAWGHSQGGHAALFTALEAETYAPELTIRGVASAAPAAELGALFSQQYDKDVSWGIGPDIVASWTNVYPHLQVDNVLTRDAKNSYQNLASGCLDQELLGLEVRNIIGSNFFSTDPMQQDGWKQAVTEQTPDVTKIPVPIYVAQGLSDPVVLPNTTALLQQNACDAKKFIEVQWFGNVNHQLTAVTAGPSAIEWVQDRFNDIPATSNCNQLPPVVPAKEM